MCVLSVVRRNDSAYGEERRSLRSKPALRLQDRVRGGTTKPAFETCTETTGCTKALAWRLCQSKRDPESARRASYLLAGIAKPVEVFGVSARRSECVTRAVPHRRDTEVRRRRGRAKRRDHVEIQSTCATVIEALPRRDLIWSSLPLKLARPIFAQRSWESSNFHFVDVPTVMKLERRLWGTSRVLVARLEFHLKLFLFLYQRIISKEHFLKVNLRTRALLHGDPTACAVVGLTSQTAGRLSNAKQDRPIARTRVVDSPVEVSAAKNIAMGNPLAAAEGLNGAASHLGHRGKAQPRPSPRKRCNQTLEPEFGRCERRTSNVGSEPSG
ncbi:hypothetical protein BIW11_04769 [Tropilaelaps mercedesae]|uniref:Uncharacterized protein n=1 Tax=Tropilaelaps mercedesae TaxID=418985 RepID=A0A1V9X1D0_9ACAR|nr:hypothetical protein BIW11_04769 [Tropilaelaps mercedesae]